MPVNKQNNDQEKSTAMGVLNLRMSDDYRSSDTLFSLVYHDLRGTGWSNGGLTVSKPLSLYPEVVVEFVAKTTKVIDRQNLM